MGEVPSGQQYELRHGPYRAVVTEVGAALRELTHDGRALVRGFAVTEPMPLYRGAVLAPWPNRIADGRYSWAGREHQLPITEVDRHTALHGLAAWLPWTPVVHRDDEVELACRLWPQPGYPFLLDLRIAYRLGDDGLAVHLAATNRGEADAPYGCSIHPYLVAGTGRLDEWTLHLPASSYLTVDDRLLPTGVAPVRDGGFDFRTPRRLGAVEIDHAFTDVDFGADGTARATVIAADGSGVALSWDAACRWVQVHTADRPEPDAHRVGLALEPMTCPPDAFRTGAGVISLEPGATHSAGWLVSRVAG